MILSLTLATNVAVAADGTTVRLTA